MKRSTHNTELGNKSHRLIGHVCRLIGHVCRLIGHVCRLIGHVCRLIGHVCRLIGHVCRLIGHVCRLIGHAFWLIGHVCMLIGHVCLILFLCYFDIFIHDPVPNDPNHPNELCILLHVGVTDTAGTFIVCFIGFCLVKSSRRL